MQNISTNGKIKNQSLEKVRDKTFCIGCQTWSDFKYSAQKHL